jgi:glycosyltransferase involved in cell wall biosynthesis
MAKLFCFPSFAEGFGLPPLEAMAAGVPVIVSKTTSFPEVCGSAAAYIDPEKPESIADAVNNLIKDHTVYLQKRRAGFEQAQKYNWNSTAKKIMQSLNNAVAK